MASVPLAVVLVAALVVPLAVIPGSFGFDRWPSAHSERVTERQVRLAPPRVDVVAVRTRRAVSRQQPVLVATRPARVAPTVVAAAPVPAPRRDPRPAPQPQQAHEPPRPQPNVQQSPAPQPDQPQPPQPEPTKNPSGLLANGTAPVARGVPQEAPAPQQPPTPEPQPAPAPVQQPTPTPAERVLPGEPCHGNGHAYGHANGNGGGPQGEGDSQQ